MSPALLALALWLGACSGAPTVDFLGIAREGADGAALAVKPVVIAGRREPVLAATEALRAKLAGLGYRVVDDDAGTDAVVVASRLDLRLPLNDEIRIEGAGDGACFMVSDLSRGGDRLGEAQARLSARFTGLDADGEIPADNVATVLRRCAERQAEAIARTLEDVGL